MKRLVVAIALLATAIGLFSFAPADWIMVKSDAGKFKTIFPAAPLISEDTAFTADGKIPWHTFIYNSASLADDNNIYGVAYADFPPKVANSDNKEANVGDFLDKALSMSVTGVNGEIIERTPFSWNDFPGRHVKVSFAHGKAVMDLKIILVHSRCYILQIGYQLKKEKNPSIDKFYNAFELI